ncbi:MAG: hypothetical protein ACYC4R_04530 [Anaerolineae bacterium]
MVGATPGLPRAFVATYLTDPFVIFFLALFPLLCWGYAVVLIITLSRPQVLRFNDL